MDSLITAAARALATGDPSRRSKDERARRREQERSRTSAPGNIDEGSTGHFETKSDACHCASIGLILLQELTFWRSASKVGAEARGPFHAAPIVVQFGASTLSTSPISKLSPQTTNGVRPSANSLADKLTVEAKALADLKVDKAAVEG